MQNRMVFDLRGNNVLALLGVGFSNSLIAQLSASVPEAVNKISLGSAPRHSAMVSLAASRYFLESLPKLCTLMGLPKYSVKKGSM